MTNVVEENTENTENTENNDAIQHYNTMKETLKIIIQNNVQIIILLGSGGNGKTYLINDCKNYLNTNNYNILQDCPLGEHSAIGFHHLLQEFSENYDKKVIMCCHINPFTYYEEPIEKPPNVIVLDMNHIRF